MVDNPAFSLVSDHAVVLAMSTAAHRLAHLEPGPGDEPAVVHRPSTDRRGVVHGDVHGSVHRPGHPFLIRWMSSVTWS